MHVLKSLRAQLIALHSMNWFCSNFIHRLLKLISTERWLNIRIYKRAPIHVLKSLYARIISLHYMNGFCSRLLKPKSFTLTFTCSCSRGALAPQNAESFCLAELSGDQKSWTASVALTVTLWTATELLLTLLYCMDFLAQVGIGKGLDLMEALCV